ncbi:MAG: hypothetical protein U0470_13185 [Anaerolineae bacterium]
MPLTHSEVATIPPGADPPSNAALVTTAADFMPGARSARSTRSITSPDVPSNVPQWRPVRPL